MNKAQELSQNINSLTANFGTSVNCTRTTGTTQYDIFSKPLNGTPQMFTANVIVDNDKMDLTPTLAGGKDKEILSLITVAGTLLAGDELQYNNHTYKVTGAQPIPFMGMGVADYVSAAREVDA